MEVATVAFDHLARKDGELLERTFGQSRDSRSIRWPSRGRFFGLRRCSTTWGTRASHTPRKRLSVAAFGHEDLSFELISGEQWLGRTLNNVFWAAALNESWRF